jgi:TetR/AcrR family fatty acid metabolism transcriptional regulator
MQKEVIPHVRSGGRQISLYAELGGYFSPEGELREEEFRQFIREAMQEYQDDENAGAWLSPYLDHVLGYLEDKGMGKATLRLFEVAIDESVKLGVDEVSVSPRHMRVMLAQRNVEDVPEEPRKSDSDGKRQVILDASLTVFAARGFHEATMDEIASASGVAKGTLYRYFASKEDLLEQLLSEAGSKIMERFGGVFSGSDNVLDHIQKFIEDWVGFIEENHALYQLIQAEGTLMRGGEVTVFYEVLVSNLPMVKETVVSLDEDGLLKNTSFHTVVYGIFGFIDGIAQKWFRSGRDYSLRDEIPTILEVLFNGFVKEHVDAKVYFVAPDVEGDQKDEETKTES